MREDTYPRGGSVEINTGNTAWLLPFRNEKSMKSATFAAAANRACMPNHKHTSMNGRSRFIGIQNVFRGKGPIGPAERFVIVTQFIPL